VKSNPDNSERFMQMIMVSRVKFNRNAFQNGVISSIYPARRCNIARLPKETNKPIITPIIKSVNSRMIALF